MLIIGIEVNCAVQTKSVSLISKLTGGSVTFEGLLLANEWVSSGETKDDISGAIAVVNQESAIILTDVNMVGFKLQCASIGSLLIAKSFRSSEIRIGRVLSTTCTLDLKVNQSSGFLLGELYSEVIELTTINVS